METDVRTGRLVDWSHRGVPADVQVYEHDTCDVLWNGERHVAMQKGVSDEFVAAALRELTRG